MKTVVIKNYVQGLASFLDEQNIKWECVGGDQIIIWYSDDEQLFTIGFEFGKFYSNDQNF